MIKRIALWALVLTTFLLMGSPAKAVDVAGLGTLHPVAEPSATVAISSTGVSGAAVTATIPVVAGNFHYINLVKVVMYNTAARTGGAVPVTITTTNMRGSPSMIFDSAGNVGNSQEREWRFSNSFKSLLAGTITTIICPATPSVIWQVIVFGYAGT